MIIKKLPRIEFEHNPIIEVISQVRFPTNLAIQEGLPIAFQKKLSTDFPLLEIQQGETFEVALGPQSLTEFKKSPAPAVFNMSSVDKKRKISLSSDFVAITFTEYSNWKDFIDVWSNVFSTFNELYKPTHFLRFGLRYRNLINRQKLGLIQTPWRDLIHPSAVGHLYGDLLVENFSEKQLNSCFSLSQMDFVEYKLILQSAFVDTDGEKCFILDSDFFNERTVKASDLNFSKEFEVLHVDSGSVFQAFITEKLRRQLGPKPS